MNYQAGFVAQSQYLSIHAIRRVMAPSSTATTTNNSITNSPESYNNSFDNLTPNMMFMPFSPSSTSSNSSIGSNGWKSRKPRGSITSATSHQILPNMNNSSNLSYAASAPLPPTSSVLFDNHDGNDDDDIALWNSNQNHHQDLGPRSAPMQIPKPNLSSNGLLYNDNEDFDDQQDENNFEYSKQEHMYTGSPPLASASIFRQVIADKRNKNMTAEERERGKARQMFVSQLFVSPDPNMPKKDEIIPGKPPSEIEKEKHLRYLEEKFYHRQE